jgi:hypothetical protein
MSYVEKAFYKYIKNIFTSGLKVLFSKRYIFYTVAFLLISLTTTVFFLIRRNIVGGTPEVLAALELTGNVLISVELSVAITYVLFGLFFSKYPLKFWVPPAMIFAAGGAALIYFLPIISPYIAAVCYFSWIVVSMFLTFSVSRNFWGNKVLGSIMFLGKQADEGTIIFSGIVFFFSLVNTFLSGYIIYDAVRRFLISTKTLGDITSLTFILVTVLFALIAVILVNIIIFVWGKRDDVFYTILAFFFVFSAFTLWKYAIYTFQYRNETNIIPYDNVGSIIMALFLIFYTVSRYGRRIKKIEKKEKEEIVYTLEESPDDDVSETKKEETWGLLKIPKFMGPLGVLITLMGLVLGYHVTILQFISTEDLFSTTFFSLNDLVGLKDKFAIILLPLLMIFFLLSYRWSSRFRFYSSPELYRFEMLPAFEELEERLDRIRRGEDSWKDYANMLIKEGIKYGAKSTARKVIISPTKKVAGAIGGAYSKTKSGVSKGFRRVFRRKSKTEEIEEDSEIET